MWGIVLDSHRPCLGHIKADHELHASLSDDDETCAQRVGGKI